MKDIQTYAAIKKIDLMTLKESLKEKDKWKGFDQKRKIELIQLRGNVTTDIIKAKCEQSEQEFQRKMKLITAYKLKKK